MSSVTIRRMTQGDLAAVSALGIGSKASWGYSSEEMRVFGQELTLSVELFVDLLAAQVAISEGVIVGYFTVRKHPDGLTELEHLFVHSDMFHRGIGTLLFQRALEAARLEGEHKLTIICDPNSEGFYQRLGARKIGDHQSSIPDRTIPIYEISAENTNSPPSCD